MDRNGVMACNPLAIVASISGTLTFNLVAALGIRGSSMGLVSACASSGHALGTALDEIRLGRQKRMLVVGAEDCNFESIVPFCGMRALSLEQDPDLASRPFDIKRNGFVGLAVTIVLRQRRRQKSEGSPLMPSFLAGDRDRTDTMLPYHIHKAGDFKTRCVKPSKMPDYNQQISTT